MVAQRQPQVCEAWESDWRPALQQCRNGSSVSRGMWCRVN